MRNKESTTQENTGFRVKPGMTNRTRLVSPHMALMILFFLVGWAIVIEPIIAYGQSEEQPGPSPMFKRDPFVLPRGVRLLKNEPLGRAETKPEDTGPLPLKIKAILISDHIRLASIDRYIVTVGDLIYDEKVLEIKADQVILGKGKTKRTIFLDQSPLKLTVERQGEKR